MTRRSGVTAADIEEARRRAIAAGPLPANVRRQLVALWQKQDALPRDLRSLTTQLDGPSGWVLHHLFPLLCMHLATDLRREAAGPAAIAFASRLDDVATYQPIEAVRELVEPPTRGRGARSAATAQVTALRVLDLGLLGFPVVAAVTAQCAGLLDTSTSLVADGVLTVEQATSAATALDGETVGDLTATDLVARWSLPEEVLLPLDLDAVPVEGIAPVSSGRLDDDSLDEELE